MRAIPVLHVASSEAAGRFYCDSLGFERRSCYRPFDDRADPCYLVVHREGAWIHLSSFRDDSAPGAAVYVVVDSVDEVFDELTRKGVAGGMEPTDQSWGNREVYVNDPDGNSIRFVEERPGP